MMCRMQGFWIVVVLLAVMLGATAVTRAQEAPSFTDVTELAGITLPDRAGHTNKVTGQAWGDYDQDGWLDLYLTDTEGANVLYRNNGDGTFSISPLTASISLSDALSGGAVFADYDNDGWPDLYVMNWGQNVLFHNDGGDNFSDVTAAAGVGDTANGQSVSWGDYDRDGFIDLYVANASCYPDCDFSSEKDKDRLYHNSGDGTFTDVTHLLDDKTGGEAPPAVLANYDHGDDLMAAGVAAADYDQDGRVDMVVGNYEQGYRLYRNQGATNNWLTLKLVGNGRVNRDAIGARVTVTDSDGRSQMQEVKCGSSLGAGNALELYFGLGPAAVTAVTVQWPDGTVQELGPMPPNQRRELNYGVNPITPINVEAAPAVDEPVESAPNGFGAIQTILQWAVIVAAIILAYNLYLYWQAGNQQ